MPEGPEVEITARALHRALSGHRLAVEHLDGARLSPARSLDGAALHAVTRAGKWLGFRHDAGTTWLHLGMSGRFRLTGGPDDGRHTRLVLTGQGIRAELVDPRRFSRAATGPAPPGPGLGPDVLGDPAAVAAALTGRRRAAKALLLDPSVVAGVGNYLADEALHAAGVHPCATHLTAPAARSLARAAGAVAARSLALGGMSMRDWAAPDGTRGGMLDACAVFRRAGLDCARCGTELVSGHVASRTTTWCPRCQPVDPTVRAENATARTWPSGGQRAQSSP